MFLAILLVLVFAIVCLVAASFLNLLGFLDLVGFMVLVGLLISAAFQPISEPLKAGFFILICIQRVYLFALCVTSGVVLVELLLAIPDVGMDRIATELTAAHFLNDGQLAAITLILTEAYLNTLTCVGRCHKSDSNHSISFAVPDDHFGHIANLRALSLDVFLDLNTGERVLL
jgi:hypothetical protein